MLSMLWMQRLPWTWGSSIMNIMLDTHLVLWFAKGDARFPDELLEVLQDRNNNKFVSETSLLEIEIKHAKQPEAIGCTGSDFVSLCERGGFVLRPITREAILAYGTLDFKAVGDLHKDPFDRLLIAHAKSEGLRLATHDRILALYGEPCVQVYA